MGETGGRRGVLSRFSNLAMLAGLVGGYGAFAWIAGRFLYPAKPTPKRWMFVTEADEVGLGESVLYRGPSGETINIARLQDGFIALSSTCPHLGCQVFWEAQNNRFYCPCHNGAFDPAGKGISGPPGDAQMELPRYELKVENGLLMVEVPLPQLAEGEEPRGELIRKVAGIHGPGHDPCLVPKGRA